MVSSGILAVLSLSGYVAGAVGQQNGATIQMRFGIYVPDGAAAYVKLPGDVRTRELKSGIFQNKEAFIHAASDTDLASYGDTSETPG